MEALLHKLMLLRSEAETKADVSKARRRALASVGLVLGMVAACIIGYIVFSSMSTPNTISEDLELRKMVKPDLFICSGDTEPPLESLKRAKRQRANGSPTTLIKRVPRPLSPLPPTPVSYNFSYNPPLYHDAGARCAWGHLSNKRVPHLEDVGVAYDFQQLEARSCDDPEECKSMCLRMHKTDDPYLCNYFTWHRQKKLALFYFLEPTLKWNLTEDNRVETFFWQCRETQCAWWWRPHRIFTHLSDLTATQLKKSQGLLAVTQCSDFASCQFSCETRPSFRELGVGQQVPEGAHPDDPSCAYVVMPSKGTQNRESFLFTMPQTELKNVSYRGSSFYDSFELICQGPETTTFPTLATTPPPAPASQPPAAAQPPPPPLQPPPPPPPAQTNSTSKKRQLKKREAVNIHNEMKLRECKLRGENIDCTKIQVKDKNHASECIQLDAEAMSQSPTSITLETKRPVWLVLQHQASLDELEQSLQLTPGLKHNVDVLAQKHDKELENKRCGPPHLRHRRCTTGCNDRLAVDACGCTLTPDLDPESASALLAVPICDEQKLRSCVHPHLEQASDMYFDCMRECKAECSPHKPFTMKSKATSLSDIWAKDVIEMNLSFLGASSSGPISSHPVSADVDGRQFIYIWVPILVLAVLLVAFVLCYCARRLM